MPPVLFVCHFNCLSKRRRPLREKSWGSNTDENQSFMAFAVCRALFRVLCAILCCGTEFLWAAVASSHPIVRLVGGPTSDDEGDLPSSDTGTAVWRLLGRDLQHKPGHDFQDLGPSLVLGCVCHDASSPLAQQLTRGGGIMSQKEYGLWSPDCHSCLCGHGLSHLRFSHL